VPTWLLLPVKHFDQWMLLIWDFARRVRETVIFKENELEENQWEVVSQIECLILEVATKYGIPQG
jgi:hypothetical protein